MTKNTPELHQLRITGRKAFQSGHIAAQPETKISSPKRWLHRKATIFLEKNWFLFRLHTPGKEKTSVLVLTFEGELRSVSLHLRFLSQQFLSRFSYSSFRNKLHTEQFLTNEYRRCKQAFAIFTTLTLSLVNVCKKAGLPRPLSTNINCICINIHLLFFCFAKARGDWPW